MLVIQATYVAGNSALLMLIIEAGLHQCDALKRPH